MYRSAFLIEYWKLDYYKIEHWEVQACLLTKSSVEGTKKVQNLCNQTQFGCSFVASTLASNPVHIVLYCSVGQICVSSWAGLPEVTSGAQSPRLVASMAYSLRPRHPPSLNVQLDILDARQESEYINLFKINVSTASKITCDLIQKFTLLMSPFSAKASSTLWCLL